MGNLELAETLKTLQGERTQTQNKLAQLDRAIAVIRELAGTHPTSNGHPKRWTMSAAGRRKIAKAQKLRWAQVKAQQKSKA
jgi:hypothetical protein